jgi:putative membrane protein
MEELISLKSILGSVVYSVVGITILVIAYIVFEKITPENLRKEIIEKQNTALAIVSASFILAIAIIIATAIHG